VYRKIKNSLISIGSERIKPVRNIFVFSLTAGVVIGAGVAAVSEGAFGPGWLAASVLAFTSILILSLIWRWAGGGRKLAVLLIASFALRLGIGIFMSLGLQAFGYEERVQQAGYVYADAYSRDQEDAWSLAISDKPIWASFQQEFLSDQYGGSLALNALVYRTLSPDAHRRFLILILTAFSFTVGLPFFIKAIQQRWGDKLIWPAAWLLVLYPESILVGASQMREPFLLGLMMIAFWAIFRFQTRRRQALGVFALASLLMFAFSSRSAIVVIGALLVCGWLEYIDELFTQRWKWLGWVTLGIAAVLLMGLSWGWLNLATAYDAGQAVSESGQIQKIMRDLGGEDLRNPFVMVYGLTQPVLPAALMAQTSSWIWKIIGILRASGWYALAPFLLYAIFTCWRAQTSKDRQMLLWLALSVMLWAVLCSARAGGDQWDNPRYRVLFLPFMAILTAWGWQWSREKRDAWVWAWVASDFLFVAVFMAWYLSRLTGAVKLPFWTNVALILAGTAVLLFLGWVWNLKRQHKSIRGEVRSFWQATCIFLTLKPDQGEKSLHREDAKDAKKDKSKREEKDPSVLPRLNRWDALVILFFLGFAALYFLGRLQSNFPYIILSGDAGNITSIAAAQAKPDLFRGDPVLGDPTMTGFYATIHIPIIKALAPLAGGDFAWAFTWLVGPHVFLQLLGFYLLGRALFRGRSWAFLLALLTAMPFLDVGVGEMWGVWRDALPRITFQTVLPYLLALVVVWRNQPRRWPWLMILAGLMVFLHSISTPAWGLAIWLGLWLYHPAAWKWPKRLGVMFGLGLLFLLALSPFAINFLSYQSRGASPDYDLVMTVIRTYLPENLLNVPAAFGGFLWAATRSLLLPLALLGGWILWRYGRPERRLVGMVILWGAGIFATAIVLPLGERIVESALRIPPIDTELVRGMRYFVPWLLIFWLWPLVELSPRFVNPKAARAMLLVGVLLLGGWTVTHTPEGRKMVEALTCLSHRQLVCGDARDSTGFITTLREQTPPGAKIFNFNQNDNSTSNALSIRYNALRPMVYTVRDAGLFLYANRAAYTAWLPTTRQVDAIQLLTDPNERLARLVPIAQQYQADYLSVDFSLEGVDLKGYPVELVWKNNSYTLLKLR
jgi:hypothetical protein